MITHNSQSAIPSGHFCESTFLTLHCYIRKVILMQPLCVRKTSGCSEGWREMKKERLKPFWIFPFVNNSQYRWKEHWRVSRVKPLPFPFCSHMSGSILSCHLLKLLVWHLHRFQTDCSPEQLRQWLAHQACNILHLPGSLGETCPQTLGTSLRQASFCGDWPTRGTHRNPNQPHPCF